MIIAVSLDMWDPYIASTRKHVESTDSRMVFDKFPIMKHMNMAVNQVRRMKYRDMDLREAEEYQLYMALFAREPP